MGFFFVVFGFANEHKWNEQEARNGKVFAFTFDKFPPRGDRHEMISIESNLFWLSRGVVTEISEIRIIPPERGLGSGGSVNSFGKDEPEVLIGCELEFEWKRSDFFPQLVLDISGIAVSVGMCQQCLI